MSLCVYALSIILSARYARIELALPQTEWVRQQQKRVPLRIPAPHDLAAGFVLAPPDEHFQHLV